MAVLYERLYAEQFSKRTLLVAAYFLACYYALMMVVYSLGGRWDWLSLSFFVYYFIASLPFLAVLVTRLKPAANPEKMIGIFGTLNLWSILSWFLANWAFVYFYFNEFAPSYLVKYSYPEGKYGPPLMREQPFYLIAFSAFLALFGYSKLVWRYKNVINVHLEGSPKLIDLIFVRYCKSWIRLGYILAYSFISTMVWKLILMVPAYNIYATWISFFHPVRRSSHSFWEFLDFRLFYHFLWVGVILLILYTLIEALIEYHFGRCFHICKNLCNSNVVLLEGLKSSRTAIRNQALLELRFLILNDIQWRESLFRDFVGEEAISRNLCHFFIDALREYSFNFQIINEDFKLFSEKFTEASGISIRSEEDNQKMMMPTNSVFSPHRRNIVDRILDPLSGDKYSPNQSKSPLSHLNRVNTATATQKIPEILEVKSHSNDKQHYAHTTKNSQSEIIPSRKVFRNKYLQLCLFIFGRFAQTFPGKVYASMACEMIKEWLLNQEEPMTWLLESLSAFIIASYDEDVHGQVQFELNNILGSLADLVENLGKFDSEPHLNGRRMLDDLFGVNPSPTEKRTRTLIGAAMGCLESIIEKFGDSLGQLNLDPLTTTKLRILGLSF